MKIGILGGAFDPIHNDHIATAKAVLNAGLVDRVNIMPCYSHKFGKEMASPEFRYLMVVLACLDEFANTGARLFPDKTEIEAKHSGSTYDLLTQVILPRLNPKDSIHYIIGSDNARNISKWHNYKELLRIVNFIVVQRKGDAPASLCSEMFEGTKNSLLYTDTIGDLSSTRIREAIKNKRDISNFVPKSVVDAISFQELYQ